MSETARELANRLAAGVEANGHKLPRKGTQAHRRWPQEMDRLLRLDGRDAEEVRRVIDWCVSDYGDDRYPGEAVNVRSAKKLRERYSELRLKAQPDKRTTADPRNPDPDNRDGPDGRPRGVL